MEQKPNFNEENHEYKLNDTILTPVTKVLQSVGLAPNYDNVSLEILDAKANLGTLIHKEISDWLKYKIEGMTDELQSFIKWFKNSDYEFVASEEIVWNDFIAGTFDILLRHKKTRRLVMADIKTTATPHLESTSAQTSIYSYLWEKRNKIETINECLMLWFDKEAKLTPIKLYRQPNEKVEKILECFQNSEEYKEDNVAKVQYELSNLEYIENSLNYFELLQKQFETKEKELKEALLNYMETNGIYSLKTDKIEVSYVRPTTRNSFDSARFKEEQKDLYEQYQKSTQVKASVRIKERKEK